MKFQCKKSKEFLDSFKDCEKCEEKEDCINYNYEIEFQKRRKEVKEDE